MEETPPKFASFMSAEINELATALSKFQGALKQPKLNSDNPFFRSKYVDLSGCFNAAQSTLEKFNLSVTQLIVGSDLITMLMHSSGQWIRSITPIPEPKVEVDSKTGRPKQNILQVYGSELTYLKRYSYCAILGIASDVDEDGNNTDVKFKKAKSPLEEAIDEVNAASSRQQVNDVWAKWSALAPALCKDGSEFYNAVGKKIAALKKAN